MKDLAAPTAATRLLALLGDPVRHSLSPVLHNAALRALGLDAAYLALRCSASDFAALLHGIARAEGAGNVTIPHKEIAALAIERPSAAVQQTGACNTFWLEQGKVCGDNTDVEGFLRAAQLAFGELADARVLLLGAGGAARAVVAALSRARADRIDVLARNPRRAARLSDLAAPASTTTTVVADASHGPFDLIVNATPLGLYETDPFPFPVERLSQTTAVMDLVYCREETAWVRAARAAGLRATDGKEMLVQQAIASFTRWFQREPPSDVMRAVLAAVPPA